MPASGPTGGRSVRRSAVRPAQPDARSSVSEGRERCVECGSGLGGCRSRASWPGCWPWGTRMARVERSVEGSRARNDAERGRRRVPHADREELGGVLGSRGVDGGASRRLRVVDGRDHRREWERDGPAISRLRRWRGREPHGRVRNALDCVVRSSGWPWRTWLRVDVRPTNGGAWQTQEAVRWSSALACAGVAALAGFTPVWFASILAGKLVARRRVRRGCCAACGYDVRTYTGPACPECGSPVPGPEPRVGT